MDLLFEIFKARAEAANAEVHRFGTTADAVAYISKFVEEQNDDGNSYALWAECPLLREIKKELPTTVSGLRFEVTRENAAAAKIGISQMNWAIANTGTLVQDATEVQQRLVSTLPMVHVAVIGTNQIVADLSAVLREVSPQKMAYISFITGPSRTADIERVLTIGVHGPGRLVVVVVDQIGRAS